MNDTISRQQAITALRALSDEDGYINVPHEVVTDVVRGLPHVRAEHEQTTQSEQGDSDKFGVKISETCEDCISRQAAIELYEQFQPCIAVKAIDFKKALEQLPSAQPEQRWIPVSERLPETDGEVLITVLDMEEDYVEVYKGFYQDQEWWTQWCHGCLKIKDEPCGENTVTAWMPLPTPYKEG